MKKWEEEEISLVFEKSVKENKKKSCCLEKNFIKIKKKIRNDDNYCETKMKYK